MPLNEAVNVLVTEAPDAVKRLRSPAGGFAVGDEQHSGLVQLQGLQANTRN